MVDYWLEIGTTAGGKQLYSREMGTATSAVVTNLPTDGTTIYVTLYSRPAGGTWLTSQAGYATAP